MGDHPAWIERLKGALGTGSMAFVDATLIQLQAAARLPNSGVSEIAINAALAMIESERPNGETECAIVVQTFYSNSSLHFDGQAIATFSALPLRSI
jgi:hypothetical protein